ncbi:hypothetical protein [Rhodococcus artemisiae]|uniref:DUF2975 domain-containing protein n=1 Tax=Rhodococcus artemisiae TaxID=714159 RepID=A0ABU7LAM8_9NOCA|nr:hypothetical protein [Rhodococcus artemisiae]MEE2058342.1 hypothetical protein [Rhodococcus artemisiae]
MNTTDSEPITPTDTSKKDRRDLWASITVFALTGGVVLYTYFTGLLRELNDGIVTARVEFDEPQALTSLDGVAMQLGSPSTIDVSTDPLSPVTVGFLRSADALQTFGYLAVLALLTWMVVRFVRGHLFDRLAVRLVAVSSLVAVATILVPQFPRTLGTNMLLRDVEAREMMDTATLGPEFWYGYVFCMALSAVAVALRIGSRMARDNEGLV